MWRNRFSPPVRLADEVADICLIAEGCYPYVAGGVSSWVDWLMRSQGDLTFSVVAILPGAPDGEAKYPRPENLVAFHHVYLDQTSQQGRHIWPAVDPQAMAALLGAVLADGEGEGFRYLISLLGTMSRRPSVDVLLNSPQAWDTLCSCYGAMPQSSFLGYFWAWRTLVGGLFRVLNCDLPRARAYHAVSTGYAGVLAARASIESGRPALITEHGIYSNERRIEILMADWISNSIEHGLDLLDDRRDIREFWARAFESFARIAYSQASEIVALYEANQAFQLALGASPDKLRIIPNGVDMERFANLARPQRAAPTIAFIGRVTPIKDVQTFIDVAAQLSALHPGLRAMVIGPMDEDPDYAANCRAEVQRRDLADVIEFTGPVDVRDYLGSIDILVLTSISEALPLVILEAGAAGVPCVANDVGACREIIEGHSGSQNIGPGGAVVPVGASEDLAIAISRLLSDPVLRRWSGDNLKRRVEARYRAENIAAQYSEFYARHVLRELAESA
jgi:glycosyltransferase involved in cell wall biosynthesis